MAHHKMDSNATDTTALSGFSYDNDKQSLLDMSSTDCVLPELLKTTNPTEEEHTKPSSPRQREGTVDPPPYPPVIPPEHSSRTLVLCFDGTGDQFDADNSNIVQLVSLLKKDAIANVTKGCSNCTCETRVMPPIAMPAFHAKNPIHCENTAR